MNSSSSTIFKDKLTKENEYLFVSNCDINEKFHNKSNFLYY